MIDKMRIIQGPWESHDGEGRACLTSDQVADRLNVSRQKVLELCRRGRLPHVRLGDLYRFDSEKLEGWILRELRRSVKK